MPKARIWLKNAPKKNIFLQTDTVDLMFNKIDIIKLNGSQALVYSRQGQKQLLNVSLASHPISRSTQFFMRICPC